MADQVGTISGIASGIQWRDMVDQIVALETSRAVTPLTTRQTAYSSAATAWTEFQAVVGRFRDAAKAVRDATNFIAFTASATKSASTSRELVSATTDYTASPGTYSIEVSQLAAAEKLSGGVWASATTALDISGSFAVNGQTVTLVADDTLTTLRDKVNALNVGTTPSRVSASILRSVNGARLVLSSTQTGADGIELTDDGLGTLESLGFSDGTTTANIASNGLTQSTRLSSGTAAIASLLGIPLPTPSVITVGGQQISVDFTVDSLATIVARINAATGNTTAASVTAETVDGRTTYRLQTSLAVEVDQSDAAASARSLAVLGLTKTGRSGVTQVVKSANTFTNAASPGNNADAATLLSSLQVGGQSLGLASGDTITITGKRGDGTVVSRTLVVGVGSTMQDLMTAASTGGFGSGARTASLAMSSGQLTLTDSAAGDSQLAMSISVAKQTGGTISLGAFGTSYGGEVGRNRQITQGTDAIFKVDDQVVTRSSNSVSDVITGVTLNLLAAETDSAVDLAVARNLDAATSALQSLASAYNEVQTWATTNGAAGKRLAGNGSLRTMASSLSNALLQSITGVTGSYTTAAMVGLERNSAGVLAVNSTTLKNAMTLDFEGVRRLLTQVGVPSDSEVVFEGATSATQATASPVAVEITRVATLASQTGAAFGTGGFYVTAGTPDTMSIKDVASGNSGTVSLTNNDTLAVVVAKLNAAFAVNKLRLVASQSAGALNISASDYGTSGGFTIAYTPGTGDGTAQVGIAAGTYSGLDVAGTIDGVAATGKGRMLTADSSLDVAGLSLTYLGSTVRTAGTVSFSKGVGGTLYDTLYAMALDNDGQVATLATSSNTSASALDLRIASAQDRVAKKREALIAQFVRMEASLSKAQSLGSSLASQINGLFNYNKQV